MKVQDLTVEQLKTLIGEVVEEKLKELLGDPDWGMELREEVKERLKLSLKAAERGEGGILPEEVAGKLGLEW